MKPKTPKTRELYPFGLMRVRELTKIRDTANIILLCGKPDFQKGTQMRWINPPGDFSGTFGIFGDIRALRVRPVSKGAGRLWHIGKEDECQWITKRLMLEWWSTPLGKEAEKLKEIIETVKATEKQDGNTNNPATTDKRGRLPKSVRSRKRKAKPKRKLKRKAANKNAKAAATKQDGSGVDGAACGGV